MKSKTYSKSNSDDESESISDSESDYEDSVKRKSSQTKMSQFIESPQKKAKQSLNLSVDLYTHLISVNKAKPLSKMFISLFQNNPLKSFREIINCLYQIVGINLPITLDKLDDLDDYFDKLNEMLPVSVQTKQSKSIKPKFLTLVKEIMMSKSAILYDKTFLPYFIRILIALSQSHRTVLRHLASLTSYTVGESLLIMVKGMDESEHINSDYLLSNTRTIFKEIFIHRYRDVSADIRADTLVFCGRWILLQPDDYCNNNYIKYYGWMLNDVDAKVRCGVILVLTKIYQNDDISQRLHDFTNRFMARICSMTNDVDSSVRSHVIELCHILSKQNYLEDKDIFSIYQNILSPDSKVAESTITLLLSQVRDEKFEESDSILLRALDEIEPLLNQNSSDKSFYHFTLALYNHIKTTKEEILSYSILIQFFTETYQVLTDAQQIILSSILLSYWIIISEQYSSLNGTVNKDLSKEFDDICDGLKTVIPKLMVTYQNDNLVVEKFIKMYNNDYFHTVIPTIRKTQFEGILKTLSDYFFINQIDSTLIAISNAYHSFLTNPHEGMDIVLEFVADIVSESQTQLTRYFKKKTEKINRNCWLRRLSIFTRYNDLPSIVSEEFSLLIYNYMCDNKETFSDDDKQCAIDCLSILSYQLCWLVQSVITNEQNIDTQLFTTSFNRINVLFEIICDLYPEFDTGDELNDQIYQIYSTVKCMFCEEITKDEKYATLLWDIPPTLLEKCQTYFHLMMSDKEISDKRIEKLMQFHFSHALVNQSLDDMYELFQYFGKKEKKNKKDEVSDNEVEKDNNSEANEKKKISRNQIFKTFIDMIKSLKYGLLYDTMFGTIKYMYLQHAHIETINTLAYKFSKTFRTFKMKDLNIYIKGLINMIKWACDNDYENQGCLVYLVRFIKPISSENKEIMASHLETEFQVLQTPNKKYKELLEIQKLLNTRKDSEVIDD